MALLIDTFPLIGELRARVCSDRRCDAFNVPGTLPRWLWAGARRVL